MLRIFTHDDNSMPSVLLLLAGEWVAELLWVTTEARVEGMMEETLTAPRASAVPLAKSRSDTGVLLSSPHWRYR